MQAGSCLLVLIGSGETSPTMVTVHKALVSRLSRPADAVLLDTPYAFQENAADVSARATAYFARSVGIDVTVLPGTDGTDEAARRAAGRLRTAGWAFAGPGSPSYALRRWREGQVAGILLERVAAGTGVTVLASAAAAAAGAAALPVYEIYKAGADPHWLTGLDLLSAAGLSAAVIPHYDNAEGGTHDTRYCYLGERRLALLERDLPAGSAVVGIDEHTAVVFDLTADTVEVRGRGGMTIRRSGSSVVLAAPAFLSGAALRELVQTGAVPPVSSRLPGGRAGAPHQPPSRIQSLPELSKVAERRFEAALGDRDAAGMATAVLDLEDAVHAWRADTDEDQGTGQARAVLRALIARLGAAADEGLRTPADLLGPAVGPLLGLRTALRSAHRYGEADVIRAALAAAGVPVSDERVRPAGTRPA